MGIGMYWVKFMTNISESQGLWTVPWWCHLCHILLQGHMTLAWLKQMALGETKRLKPDLLKSLLHLQREKSSTFIQWCQDWCLMAEASFSENVED